MQKYLSPFANTNDGDWCTCWDGIVELFSRIAKQIRSYYYGYSTNTSKDTKSNLKERQNCSTVGLMLQINRLVLNWQV